MRARIVVVAIVLAGSPARADRDFFSSSPGPLTQSHAPWDAQDKCNDCHVDNTRVVDDAKCLRCHDHKDLAGRIKKGEGFHAKPIVTSKKCSACHHEHQKGGRQYDLMGWSAIGGQASFDHALTDWPLEGKHVRTDCAACHKATNKQGLRVFMGTEKSCGGCHAKEQPHRFVRKEMLACERCHTASAWNQDKQPKQFDHDSRRDAAMPLLGNHAAVPCAKCHPKNVFDLPAPDPVSCGNAGCHKSPHDGHLFGRRPCQWCHSPTFARFGEKSNRDMPFFDHSEKTRFDLIGHERLECKQCHTTKLGEARPAAACEQCHAKDNKHRDRFAQSGSPPRCGTCHPTGQSWKQNRFDHAQKAGFELTAKHGQIGCRKCHRGATPAEFEDFRRDRTCKGCHEHRTAHADAANPGGPWTSAQCLKCHARPGDKGMRSPAQLQAEWHGPRSDFPLRRKHDGLDCVKCHKKAGPGAKTTFQKESRECATRCHEDSLHRGTLGSTCSACHQGGSFAAPDFDHQAPMFPDGTPGYALRGEHLRNKCEDCHTKARTFKGTARACSAVGCHASDDAHKGRLGDRCEQCHVETGDNLFNHNTMSRFHLDGKHLEVRCADCHPSVTFKPRPTTCFGCHPEPAVHKGQYGTGCEQCHTTRTWEDVKPLHDVGDFSLRGQHGQIACERCHRDNRPLAGSGNLCINCHRQDDIHNNSLSPKCGECHTQWSFAPARFDHTRVGCSLTGLHRTLACADCHKNGNYAGLVAECASCHLDDALKRRHTRMDPQGDRLARCTGAGCHNANAWSPQSGAARESVCR